MKRLGQFSGKIYSEEEAKGMEECGIILSDSEANNEEFISKHHVKDLQRCLTCIGCPLAQKSIVKC